MKKPWDHIQKQALAQAEHIFTLLDEEEQRMLFHFGQSLLGQGAIVDLGCHLGGSTARLALGAIASGFLGEVHLFDRFIVKYSDAKLYERLPPNFSRFGNHDDTEPIVRALLADIPARFIFHKCEFLDDHWDGDPVELLFIDIGKNLRTMDHVAEEFYPSLIPGVSIVIQQDFQYQWNPWISVHCELWADKFEYLAHTESESVIFRLCEKITKEEAISRRLVDLNDAELKACFAKSQKRFAGTSIGLRLDEMAKMWGDGEFPRRTIGKKFIRLKDKHYSHEEAEALRLSQTSSGIRARRRRKASLISKTTHGDM